MDRKIATEQEAHYIGGKGVLPEENKCCTFNKAK